MKKIIIYLSFLFMFSCFVYASSVSVTNMNVSNELVVGGESRLSDSLYTRHVYPVSNNVFYLGHSSLAWNRIYVNRIYGSAISDSVSSTSPTTAASSKAVKTTYDLANTKISQSDGDSRYLRRAVNTWHTSSDNQQRFYFASNSHTYIKSLDQIRFRTGGHYDRLTILSNGNVGIGTTSPNRPLDVAGTSRFRNHIYLTGGNRIIESSNGYAMLRSSNSHVYLRAQGSSANMYFSTGGTSTRMFIHNNGNVGIGTTSPQEKLHVNGKIRGNQLCIGTDCKSSWSTNVERVKRTVTNIYASTADGGKTVTVTCPSGMKAVSCAWGRNDYPNYAYYTLMLDGVLDKSDGYFWIEAKRKGEYRCEGNFATNVDGYYQLTWFVEATCM